MRIAHICLGCFYVENYSYQENIIPKYHKKMGHDVFIVASTLSFDENGESCNVSPTEFINEDGIPVKRLGYSKRLPQKFSKFLRLYSDVYDSLVKIRPDIIFIHGCQFMDIREVIKYLKINPETIVYVDNHADFSNSARNWISRTILHGIFWKQCAKRILPYTKKFYGVLPARVDFLKNVYGIPKNMIELLVMGADDEVVKKVNTADNRKKIRSQYGIKEDEFLIITGGKIDSAKKQVLHLLQAIKESTFLDVRVIVFGSVVKEMKDDLMDLCDDKRINYIGWLNNEEIYSVLSASDLAVYPGRHSVLWEQTVGLGIPMIAKYWEGTTHIDVGGNVKFIREDSVENIKLTLKETLNNKEYQHMLDVAQTKGTKEFSYAKIAEKSIN